LSNFAGSFPLVVNGAAIRTTEALYQACRFPHLPDLQRAIVAERNPMRAKWTARAHAAQSRPDWAAVRVEVMRWCLRVKLAQHPETFGHVLRATGRRPIVEDSARDRFWGAVPADGATLVGRNVLGRLLSELRDETALAETGMPSVVLPLALPRFDLEGTPIGPVERPAR